MSKRSFNFGLLCLLIAIIGLSFGAYESYLRKELEKKNVEMEQELFDIRWQLEQVPWICGVAND